ncbi:MAG: FkbM family methyltransferase, partial [Alphaproteobacteria bacterium]
MTTTPAKTDAASTPTRASVAEIMDWRPLMESYAVSEGIPMPDSLEVSPEDIQRYSELYDGFSASRIGDDYDYVHSVRFRATAALFGGYLERSRKIVELGGHSRIGVFAQTVFQSDYQAYESELRDRFNLPNGAFDCVLCLEVIEHIKDTAVSETTIERIASFNYSGVMNVLSEAFRVLRPGGVLLITTPNAASVDVIFKVMQGEHPHLFEPHVRELAPKQVKAFAERVGFHLEAFGTFFAWGTADEDTRSRILEFISQMGFDPSNRGDDAVYVLRKPLAVSNGSTARETAAYWRAAHHKGEVPDYEEFLSNAFAKFIEPGNVIVDIGVNYGRHFKSFQTLTGEGGRVIGFEPVPAFVEHSKMICGADAEIRQKALSDKPGAGEFLFMTKAVGESGFKERASQGDRGAVPISVEISTLDEELQGLDRLNYIKIDTEGHELSILRGAEAVIARCRPIVSVEWGQPTYTLYGHSKGDLFD